MARWKKSRLCLALALWTVVALPAQEPGMTSVSTSIDVQPTSLVANPIGENRLSYNGDYTGLRYSILHEVNMSNVASACGIRTSSWKQTMRTCFVSTHVPVIYFGMSTTPMETETTAPPVRR